MPFALYFLALAVFVMGTSEFMLAGLLPAIATDLDVPIGTAGMLNSGFAIGMVVGAPLMAAFARRWPPRLTLVICLIAFTGCHAVGAVAQDFSVLLATRVLSALANAGFLAVGLSTATALVPATLKGRALSILLSGTTIATIAGVPAGAVVGTVLGWRATFWTIAILCIPAIVGVSRGLGRSADHSRSDGASLKLRDELGLLTTPRLILVMTVGALINGGTFAAFTFLAPVVTESAGLVELWVPIALAVFGVGSFFGVSVAGRLSDRWSSSVLAVGGPLLLTGWVALAVCAADPVAVMILVLVLGFLSFGVGSTVITGVMYASSAAPSMGGSYATSALNIGAAVGPVVAAIGLRTDVGLLAPVWVAAALTATALIVLLLTRRVRATGS